MATFAKTILIAGVLLNIPHLLCPLTCTVDISAVAQPSKCPHCDSNRPESQTPLPADDCRSGCCDQDPAVLVSSEVQTAPQTLQAIFGHTYDSWRDFYFVCFGNFANPHAC